MIGDLTKLLETIADKFKRYSERYIDRIYAVTDISNSIDWEAEPLGIDAKFITEFKSLHHFHNLRSVIKANNFYKDVQLTLLSRSDVIQKNSDRFWDDLRLTAFALVIESIDEIKLLELEPYANGSREQQILCALISLPMVDLSLPRFLAIAAFVELFFILVSMIRLSSKVKCLKQFEVLIFSTFPGGCQ